MMRKKNWFLAVIFIGAVINSCDCQRNGSKGNIVSYENVLNENGYSFGYKTEDTEREEYGVLDVTETEGETGDLFVTGYYKFKGSDGKIYRVDYVADKNGYRPKVSIQEDEPSVTMPTIPIMPVPVIGSAAIATLQGGGIG